jgi:hypothetical protein
MRSTYTIWNSALVLGVVLALTPCAPAQDTATVTGIVHDTTGAVVPGAHVVVRNVQTNIERTAATSGEGTYSVPLLTIGEYQVSVEKQGFRQEVQTGIVLQVDQTARIDFALQIGETHDTVTVTTEASALQTETSSRGNVIDNKETVELPLNSRSYYDLIGLAANVSGGGSGFSSAGQSSNSNNFVLNGIDNNNHNTNGAGFTPSIDAIQEFKILTGTYSAEFGRMSGGQVSVTTKAGTNQLHGSAYEFLQNSAVNARNFFTRGPLPSLKRNLFGVTAGGPIRKNKAFVFGSYEGLRQNTASATNNTVPTLAMAGGNFSGLPATVVIRNPITKVPFSGNIIPPSQISVIGAALAAYYPAPNIPTAPGAQPLNNYADNPPSINPTNQMSLRGDYTFSATDSLFITSNYNRSPSTVTGAIQPFGSINRSTSQQHGITYTHIFSPNLVAEFREGFYRSTQGNTQGDHNVQFVKQYGIQNVMDPGYDPSCPAGAGEHCNGGVPSVSVTGYAGLGGGTANPQQSHIYTYQEVGNLIWNKGSQSIHMGVDVRRGDTNWMQTATGRGAFTFSAPANSTTVPTSGNTFADLLLGYPSSVNRNPIARNYYHRSWGIDPYIQDDWKVSSTLTLNLGLRWELDTPVVDLNDSVSNFDPAAGKIFTPGLGGYSEQLWKTNWLDFAPRVGLAWQPWGPKTVIRLGGGVFYNMLGTVVGFPMALNYPNRLAQTFNSSVASPITLANPFPPIPSTVGPPPSDGSITLTGVVQNFKNAYTDQWSSTIQRQITRTMVWEIGYLGSKSTHLYTQTNINQPMPQPAGTTQAQIQAARPFPGFGNIVMRQPGGNGSYNSLESKVEKRYSNGLSFTAVYTYSKAIDEGYSGTNSTVGGANFPQNSYDFAAQKGPSGSDLRHRFVMNSVWQFPLGKGHKFGSERFVSYIVGGWQLANILTIQTGTPVFVSMGNTQISNTLSTADLPNVVANCNPNDGPRTLAQWFTTSCFAIPLLGHFGNEGRDNVYGPGSFNIDTSLTRNFVFREKIHIQFRGEAFNTDNHTNFGAPSGAFGTSAFGTISSASSPRNLQFALKVNF